MRQVRYLAASGLLLTTLVGCSSPPDSRYADAHDSAPVTSIAAHQVVDAVPRPDPILPVGNKSPYEVRDVTYHVLPNHSNYRERGIASWYGAKFNGHETSNGEIFDHYKATAAHKTLPIPSYARVTNLDNGKAVIVRVNDRGPFHPDRVIDLSYAAAVKLGYMEQGTARVEVAVIDLAGVDDRRTGSTGYYRYLQLGAFGLEASAQRLRAELEPLVTAPVIVSQVDSGGSRLYRVRVGPVDSSQHLDSVQRVLRAEGYDAGQPLP